MTDSRNNDNREERPSRFGGPQGGERSGGPGGDRGGERSGGPGGARGGGRRPGGGGGRSFGGGRRKVCQYCTDNIRHVDYKDLGRLRRHVGERGKIEPRRKLGTCARHQRSVTVAIKRARYIALLPFTSSAPRG